MTPKERAENYMRLKDGYENKETQTPQLPQNAVMRGAFLGLTDEKLKEKLKELENEKLCSRYSLNV